MTLIQQLVGLGLNISEAVAQSQPKRVKGPRRGKGKRKECSPCKAIAYVDSLRPRGR